MEWLVVAAWFGLGSWCYCLHHKLRRTTTNLYNNQLLLADAIDKVAAAGQVLAQDQLQQKDLLRNFAEAHNGMVDRVVTLERARTWYKSEYGGTEPWEQN